MKSEFKIVQTSTTGSLAGHQCLEWPPWCRSRLSIPSCCLIVRVIFLEGNPSGRQPHQGPGNSKCILIVDSEWHRRAGVCTFHHLPSFMGADTSMIAGCGGIPRLYDSSFLLMLGFFEESSSSLPSESLQCRELVVLVVFWFFTGLHWSGQHTNTDPARLLCGAGWKGSSFGQWVPACSLQLGWDQNCFVAERKLRPTMRHEVGFAGQMEGGGFQHCGG